MANDKSKTPVPATSSVEDRLAAALELLAQNQQQVLANQPAKPTNISDYMREPHRLDPVFVRPVFQHGQPVQIRGCSQDTIKHLDEMLPGEYLDGDIRVQILGRAPNEELHIGYTFPFADKDRRLNFYTKVRSFSDMVQQIAQEQKERAK